MTTLDPADVLKRAHAIGTYYGFDSFSHAAARLKGTVNKGAYPEVALDQFEGHAKDVAAFLKKVRDAGLSPQPGRPLFLWHTNVAPGRTAPKNVVIQFHAIGADRAIADAVLIRAVRALASDLSKDEPVVRINSMGDKETRARLTKELSQFFRKRADVLPPECVLKAREDLLSGAELVFSAEVHAGMPTSTEHLSEAIRKHFESVLEYLEETDTPYELAPHLLSRGGAWNDVCFEIQAGEQVSAWGSRYADLVKHFFKGSGSSVGAVIKIVTEAKANVAPLKAKSRPRFVFVHIGDEAKRESMKLADVLRRARLPLTQVLGVESLTEQMRYAETLNPPYLIIMGRKEALERSVILRERSTHTESLIPLDSLVEQLRTVG